MSLFKVAWTLQKQNGMNSAKTALVQVQHLMVFHRILEHSTVGYSLSDTPDHEQIIIQWTLKKLSKRNDSCCCGPSHHVCCLPYRFWLSIISLICLSFHIWHPILITIPIGVVTITQSTRWQSSSQRRLCKTSSRALLCSVTGFILRTPIAPLYWAIILYSTNISTLPLQHFWPACVRGQPHLFECWVVLIKHAQIRYHMFLDQQYRRQIT